MSRHVSALINIANFGLALVDPNMTVHPAKHLQNDLGASLSSSESRQINELSSPEANSSGYCSKVARVAMKSRLS